ncbi:1-deoxy-D-xylulose-5-phosphate reductoisomerase [Ammoniphilus resinae]|uniref:1-deoxy-D-xylulose 5-phosphate reductoisomerase n=1 Tax=Ammoniphilus resinae TaxID=861532 RepID=A0ABS4GNT0_9BACL|nr:1-deoxy-D-xylulose-5-phosphate reductoisomerase [Ammoniphilus resinae]MBP1931525.1 1-deoxy-D-xylulose-5-phosphate reductoisomerase [Ammoniphilus resinae]
MLYISILGSTGSIGQQTLDVISENPDRFAVVGLAAGYNWELILQQIEQFQPQIVAVATEEIAAKVKLHTTKCVQVLYGEEGLTEVATIDKAQFVVSAIVGSAGLAPTLQAIEARKTIGLANKETLVTAGHIVMSKAKQYGVPILPIDSEHSAIFQCLQGENSASVERLILTASGGAFRDKKREELRDVTVEAALQHPNWQMGAKITIDSATMMNKGLEVIEAHWLFQLSFTKIDCILHRESIVHSMVEFSDRALKAQLGTPDMRVPIQYAMTYPERIPLNTPPLDWGKLAELHFAPVDFERYPALKLAYQCGTSGGTMPTVLNAANEIIVGRFLKGEFPFLEIEPAIESILSKHESIPDPNLEEIWAADQWARHMAAEIPNK